MNDSGPLVTALGGFFGFVLFACMAVVVVLWIVLPLVLVHYLGKIRDAVETLNKRAGESEAIRVEEIQRIRAALERVAPPPEIAPDE